MPNLDPPTPPPLGLIVVGIGVAVILLGLGIWSGALNWFGRLPGDIRYESGSTRVYFPLASMLLVSIVLSVTAALIRRWF
jgi:hypothetical protein